jgi:hypothetical protein
MDPGSLVERLGSAQAEPLVALGIPMTDVDLRQEIPDTH